ncbi:hypothetical protein ACODNH_04335 [Haloarcula sp. NS06]|nr:hypothetical protein [Haloarcula sp. H-GB4]MDQ2072687.1 hypothetical protein [Haloarcula sp. H-GB4]
MGFDVRNTLQTNLSGELYALILDAASDWDITNVPTEVVELLIDLMQ